MAYFKRGRRDRAAPLPSRTPQPDRSNNKKTSFFATCIMLLSLLIVVGFHSQPAFAANHGPVVVDTSEFDAATAAQIRAAADPVIIEIYDPRDPDVSGECKKQLPAFQAAQKKFASKATFIRVDAQTANQNMLQRTRSTVCPTHLFVIWRGGDQMVARRIWGYLSEKQLDELMDEFYGIK